MKILQYNASMVRVRIAPSPTGIPHIGNTRTALFNYLFAKNNKGKFIIRIEDTDQVRLVPGAEEAIYEIFEWLGLEFDEKYKQSERLEIYKKHADILLSKNLAYKEDGAVRFKVPKDKTVFWQDAIGNKEIKFKTDVIEDFVILKSDGFPTYHLASVVDDHLMEISHVIRGDEWISSTPKHLLLYESFDFKPPVFAHLPVILGSDKTKLSKRHGAKSILDYRNEGYLKESLLNFMALLGWNPGENKEILSFDEMIKLFDLKDVNTSSPIFDIEKLKWMNGMYIRMAKPDELKSKLKSQNSKLEKIEGHLLNEFIYLAQTRMTTLNDFYDLAGPYLEGKKIELNREEKEIAKDLFENLSSIEKWEKEEILKALKNVLENKKVKMQVIYKIITGKERGLPLPESLEIFGKEETLKKLKN